MPVLIDRATMRQQQDLPESLPSEHLDGVDPNALPNVDYQRAAPTPPAPKGVVDSWVERFAPKAD